MSETMIGTTETLKHQFLREKTLFKLALGHFRVHFTLLFNN